MSETPSGVIAQQGTQPMEEDADDVRRHLKRLRGELAALDQQREAIAAHIERLVAQFGDAEIEGE